MTRPEIAEKKRALRKLPPGVWALGVVSLLMDSSSELIHSLLPIFLAGPLGASASVIGLIEGVAEATASITKIFSGVLSDRLRRRKGLAVFGYGLAAISKPLFPLATSAPAVLLARFLDRVGKGIRGAPRDALIADITPSQLRGAAFGLRQSLDSIGAFLGPLLAIALMALFANDIRSVLWIAAVPAVAAVIVLAIAVPESDREGKHHPVPLRLASARLLPGSYWMTVAVGTLFTLARFSEAFLILRASSVGLSPGAAPIVMIAMNVAYAATSYPAGIAADRIAPQRLLLAGLVPLVCADVVLSVAGSSAAVLGGTALWGLHMGLTQGIFPKLVTDAAPANLRGTAFGVFYLVTGCAMLLSSALAGKLWTLFGPAATFQAGAAFAAVTIIVMGAAIPFSGSRKSR